MLRPGEKFIYDFIEKMGGMDEVNESVKLIMKYRKTNFYPSKNDIIAAWEIDYQGIYEIVISVFTATLDVEKLTYQAMVGKLNHKIKLSNEIDRLKITADIIGLIVQTGLIDIHSSRGEYHYLSTSYAINVPIPDIDKHETILLRPQPVETNWDKVYGTGSVLLGHSMNHHEGYLRLSHLQKMNQIAFCINQEFIEQYDESPKALPADEEEEIAWEYFKQVSYLKYAELGEKKFHVQHKYCYRGRSYSCSYYLDPQGSSFKKAIVQLFNKQRVEGV